MHKLEQNPPPPPPPPSPLTLPPTYLFLILSLCANSSPPPRPSPLVSLFSQRSLRNPNYTSFHKAVQNQSYQTPRRLRKWSTIQNGIGTFLGFQPSATATKESSTQVFISARNLTPSSPGSSCLTIRTLRFTVRRTL